MRHRSMTLPTRSSITKAGLYYYVESKQDLLYQIIKLGLDDVKRKF